MDLSQVINVFCADAGLHDSPNSYQNHSVAKRNVRIAEAVLFIYFF